MPYKPFKVENSEGTLFRYRKAAVVLAGSTAAPTDSPTPRSVTILSGEDDDDFDDDALATVDITTLNPRCFYNGVPAHRLCKMESHRAMGGAYSECQTDAGGNTESSGSCSARCKDQLLSSKTLELLTDLEEMEQCLYRWGVASECKDQGVGRYTASAYTDWIVFYSEVKARGLVALCSTPDVIVELINAGEDSCPEDVAARVNGAWTDTVISACMVANQYESTEPYKTAIPSTTQDMFFDTDSDSTAMDKWCNANCNDNPPVCPTSHCQQTPIRSAKAKCSPGCQVHLQTPAFQVMEGSSEVKCLTYMLQPEVTASLSQDTISFISNNADDISECASSAGTRIPGFAAGKCTSKGMAVDCSGNGVCEEDVRRGRFVEEDLFTAVCNCNQGYIGKFCDKTVAVSEIQKNFETCTASDCGQNGNFVQCQPVSFGGEEVQLPVCACVGDFFGEKCGLSSADVEKQNQEKAQTVELLKSIEDIKKTKLTVCNGAINRFECPNTDALEQSMRGKCVPKLLDCYLGVTNDDSGDGDGDGDGGGGFAAAAINTDTVKALRTAIESKRDKCVLVSSGEEVGDVALINECAELLAPVRACAGVRCADGSCASECGTSLKKFTTAMCTDATKPVLCADSITCKQSEKECAKIVTYDGCGPGKVACPARPSVCADSLTDCEKEIGCSSDLKFCGFKRIKGTAIMNEENARPEPVCKAECAAEIVEDPEAKEVSFNSADTEEVVIDGSSLSTSTSSRPAMKMRKTSATALTNTLTSGTTATLSVAPVPDSYKQNGPFASQASTLLSAIVSIEPSTAVNVEPGKLEMCFAINDDFSSVDEVQCQEVIDKAAVIYASDTSIDAVFHRYANCKMEYSATDGCFCCTFATHFSVYTVADVAATEASADQLAINAQEVSNAVNPDVGTTAAGNIIADNLATTEASSAAPSEEGASGSGGIIGGVVGALLVIAVVVGAVIMRNKKVTKAPTVELPEVRLTMEGGTVAQADDFATTQNPMGLVAKSSASNVL
jgi:hypothetical protein